MFTDALAGPLDDLANVLDAGVDRTHLLEDPLGAAGDGQRQSGLAGARWAPEDRTRQAVLLDQTTQRLARTNQVLLPDDIVERARSQPCSEWRVAAQVLLGRGGEQVAHSVPNTRW